MSEHYILDENHNAVPVELMEWAAWIEDIEKRRVALTEVGSYRVSTVFMGLDHGFGENQLPVLFETMVFEGDGFSDKYCDRYSFWDEAMEGHNRVVEALKAGTLELY